jgi:acetyl esterase/lipase
VKCAARYLRAHADKYGIDPGRLGAIGFSAGGHLSMMLGVTSKEDGLEGEGGWAEESSRVQAVVSFFGPTQLDADDIPERVKGILKNFIGGTAGEKPDAYRKGSPITYLSPNREVGPMLLLQGTADPLVPPTQAYKMADAMGKAGVSGRVEILPGLGHGWRGAELKRTADVSFAFFDEHLKQQSPKRAAGAKEK